VSQAKKVVVVLEATLCARKAWNVSTENAQAAAEKVSFADRKVTIVRMAFTACRLVLLVRNDAWKP